MVSSSRKRKAPSSALPTGTEPAESVQDIFRRHFEAQFAPLPEPIKAPEPIQDTEENDLEDVDEWDGLSAEEEDSDNEPVEVVDHSSTTPQISTTMSKHERKTFMSNKPLDLTACAPTPTNKASPGEDDADDENSATLLKQDIELQRLLAESHLLAQPTARLHVVSNADKLFADGKLRRKTTDMRVQALHHSAGSTLTQANVPMHIRKGRAAAQASREDKRRRQARENGIILERKGGDAEGSAKRRKKSGGSGAGPRVDMPGVGRMNGAELRISERDVKSIEGPRRSFGRDKGRGGRGKR
ncbi:hypothetical protein BROUX41_002420 [Berkeleyomyces rouxiae]|uniref:uncharacterized protein n=1 Tax=Berkeleyomyces rouxiae TaxID=2035830 RepID=UPI003B7E8CCB